MKNLKIVLSAMVLVAGVIAFSSFKSNSYNKKAFDPIEVPFKYALSANTGIETPTNWSTNSTVISTCTGTAVVCAIIFDDSHVVSSKPDATILGIVEANKGAGTTSNPLTVPVGDGTDVIIYFKP